MLVLIFNIDWLGRESFIPDSSQLFTTPLLIIFLLTFVYLVMTHWIRQSMSQKVIQEREQLESELRQKTKDLEHSINLGVLERQRLTEQQKALSEVISKIRSSLELDTIFKLAATEVRQLLKADRVGVFRFYADSGFDDGEFVSEDVLSPYPSALQIRIHDHCFGDRYAVHYQSGRIQAVADIHNAGLSDCHVDVLAKFQIRANLIVPLLQGDKLWGLLCIHQCSNARSWQESEIEFVQQIATQLGIALYQAELLSQTREKTFQLEANLQELQQMQLQLVQSEKMSSLGQLVAGVAHEINNPVNFIYGNLAYVDDYTKAFLDLLHLYQHHYPQPHAAIAEKADLVDLEFVMTDLPKLLNSMKIGSDRIREIVLSLRTFSRLDQAEVKQVNIHEGIDSTLMILQHRLKATSYHAGIEVVKQYGELPLVECFAGQLNQVFMNLVVNAIDAVQEVQDRQSVASDKSSGKPSGRITISTQTVDFNQVRISIRDNGSGVPAPIRDKLFIPFFTTKGVGKGTGLGLSISHQIVERHGGTLTCWSEPGQGTEFCIQIPTVHGPNCCLGDAIPEANEHALAPFVTLMQ